MNDSLGVYLHDHLAGAALAVEMLDGWCESKNETFPYEIVVTLRAEIEADRLELKRLAEKVGERSSAMKEAAGWMSEKAMRYKLRHAGNPAFEVFEGFEFLSLGILGKKALWTALASVVTNRPELAGFDFTGLIARADEQYAVVEQQRIAAAVTAFAARS